MGRTRGEWPRKLVVMTMLMLAGEAATARMAYAQLGALVSPGRLSKAHASLEGITNCLNCHSAGKGVSASKCLTCHKPIAERIAQKKGVHRNATAGCVSCHVEHAGVDAELRPFDTRTFNHATETGFALSGLHAPLAATCASCHKSRSFLGLTADCVSCHTDAHQGALGTRCATCHTTSVKFADSRRSFDHRRTAFPLTGAHASVTCAACHRDSRTYKGIPFTSCANCHTDPHQPRFPGACSSCHTTQAWRTTKIDHSRTAFPLRGSHATVECAKCHTQPATRTALKFDTCAACHTDPHRGTFKQDCASCHDERSWRTGTFDHSTTRFPLVDKHAGLACTACHKSAGAPVAAAPLRAATTAATRGAPPAPARRPAVASPTAVDFRGLRTDCASCHMDVHQSELGVRCETCHTARTFDVPSFNHSRMRPFFAGEHAPLTCVQCHTPTRTQTRTAARAAATPTDTTMKMARVGLTQTSDACVSCHADVHAGQLNTRCETCHTVDRPKFAVSAFAHEKTRFPLTGKHTAVACASCHKVETGTFPAGTATTRRLTGIGTDCVACHQDPHAGQFKVGCQSCHSVNTFTIARYTHLRAKPLGAFFTGRHITACTACHKPSAPRSGRGATIVAYQIPTTCTACHTDIHRGALGPRCDNCHKP